MRRCLNLIRCFWVVNGGCSMDKILLNDILNINQDDIERTRIKFNISNGYTDPLDLYKENPEQVNTTWFLWHDSRRYFHTGQTAICFLRITMDTWLLTTIKRISKEIDVGADGGIGYEAEEVEDTPVLPDVPNTGDTTNVMPLIMLVLGLGMLVAGSRRKFN